MGRLTQGHFDDVFLNKIKQACIHVLDQLNDANEIDQAFDLCPSISRRNRVILSFLRDADHVRSNHASSSSASSSLSSALPHGSIRPSREGSLGTDSVASLSAQRRRRVREMQYVPDPNDSNDESDSQATVAPSSSNRDRRLDPATARNPSMSQPDYTFEQFAEHLDPTDKLLKRSLEIIIKETARQALAKKRNSHHHGAAASASTSPHDTAASLRSAIASSRAERTASLQRLRDDTASAFARRMSRVLDLESASSSRSTHSTTADLDHTYQLLRSLRTANHSLSTPPNPANASASIERRTLRDFLLTSSDGLLGSTRNLLTSARDTPSFAPRVSRPATAIPSLPSRHARPASSRNIESSSDSSDAVAAQLSQGASAPRPPSSAGITTQTISARLAEASRRNAQAARTIREAERLRSSQFIRTSIESLRASLFQLHMDLACTQLQQSHRDLAPAHPDSENPDIGASYALVMDTIELFDDTLRRLSCLVSSNTSRNGRTDSAASAHGASAPRHATSARMRISLWRARNLLLLSSMSRRPSHLDDAEPITRISNTASSRDAELRAHRHWLATLEESHWARTDVQPPCSDSIRAWRRKLAAWYHLDRDTATYPDPPQTIVDRQETHVRWHPDLELPYALDDEIMAPMTADAAAARPDPIADPVAAWDYARRHDDSLRTDLNQDDQVRHALSSGSVASALQQLIRLRSESDDTEQQEPTGLHANRQSSTTEVRRVPTDQSGEDADPDVSLTRTTSLSRRNAVRSLPLNNSDSSSIRSARSSLTLRRPQGSSDATNHPGQPATDNDAIDEDVVETSIEIGTVPQSPEASMINTELLHGRSGDGRNSPLLPPPDRPRAGRSGSYTFITTPAAVLRSRQRSESRSQLPRAAASEAIQDEGEDDDNEDGDALDERDTDAEEYIDLDLDLGMAGDYTFDFDLTDFLRSESRRLARHRDHGDDDDHDRDDRDGDGAESSSRALQQQRSGRDADEDSAPSGASSPTGIRVYVSGSGASTPAEARQATFEAYAQRARLLERRRRMEQRQQRDQGGDAAAEVATADGDHAGDGDASEDASPDSRRRRRGRNIGSDVTSTDRRDSLSFPGRTSER